MRIITLPPETGYRRPTDVELRRLMAIVYAAYPWLQPVSETAFANAMSAVGHQWRLAEPTTKFYFSSHVDNCNNFLDRLGLPEIDGNAAFAAIVGHNDIPFRLADPKHGQLLEVALDQFKGRQCLNAWRGLLDGAPLRAPLPPKGMPGQALDRLRAPRPKLFQADASGRMQEVNLPLSGTLDRRRG
jgi:hypothetical protein